MAATIVNVSGASEVFQAGLLPMPMRAKEKELGGERAETLQTYGAVSEKTAKRWQLGVLPMQRRPGRYFYYRDCRDREEAPQRSR